MFLHIKIRERWKADKTSSYRKEKRSNERYATGKNLTSPPVHGVCPPWCCFTFDNAFRRLLQDPNRILRPYIKQGWTVLDIGPGMGYFTIPMARLVGDTGKIIAADLQQEMLDGVDHRAYKAGVQERIKLQLA